MMIVDESRCTLCGVCVSTCVRGILRLGEKSIEITDPPLCLLCGHCKAVCPTDALRFQEGNEEFVPAPKKEEIPTPGGFFHFLRSRRSLRRYRNRPVEKEKLKRVIEAGRYAPTGANRQVCEYTVISGRKTLDRISDLAIQTLSKEGRVIQEALDRHRLLKEPLREEHRIRQLFPANCERMARAWEHHKDFLLYHAPALVLIHLKQGVAVGPEVDAAIASTHMVLMAETLGLGSCYIGLLVWAIGLSQELRKMLEIPEGEKVYVAFTLGYPDVEYLRLPARKSARVRWIGEFPE